MLVLLLEVVLMLHSYYIVDLRSFGGLHQGIGRPAINALCIAFLRLSLAHIFVRFSFFQKPKQRVPESLIGGSRRRLVATGLRSHEYTHTRRHTHTHTNRSINCLSVCVYVCVRVRALCYTSMLEPLKVKFLEKCRTKIINRE